MLGLLQPSSVLSYDSVWAPQNPSCRQKSPGKRKVQQEHGSTTMPTGVAIRQVDGKPGSVYYPLAKVSSPSRAPKDHEVLVRMHAAALNHRDLFIRQHMYPGIGFGIPLFADGCGIVTATGSSPSAERWLKKRVILNPGTGWKDAPEGPEDPAGYKIMGGTKSNLLGTGVDELVIDGGELEEAPSHLDNLQAAALPLAGLTAWRATMTKSGNAKPGRNILVTGVGGGVAIFALQFAVKAGANVFVTSGSEEKVARAKEMGAVGGVNYKEAGWDKKLKGMLPKDRKWLDAVVDGAGGDVVDKGARLLKDGGVIAIYGMTVKPKMDWSMGAVMKNVDLRGSTMGSRREFAEMVRFARDTKLVPVVSRVAHGIEDLDRLDGLFEEMKKGSQFGKLVIEISTDARNHKL